MKYIVNFSGGKDSTAMLLMLLERKQQIDYIVYADTGKDFPQMHDHIKQLAEYIHDNYPTAPPITTLKSDKSFDYLMFDHIKTRGKNKGKCGYGWATVLTRWCTSELKTKIIDKFKMSIGSDYVQYIGIAIDEPKQLRDIPNMRYPLAEWKITEAEALQYCYEKGFYWGGLYEHFDRVSCWCCPLKNLRELKALWKFYPDLWAELKEMDARAFNRFRADYSVEELEQKFCREDREKFAQMSLFDDKENAGEVIKKVYIPACAEHEGVKGVSVNLKWICPVCGQPRGEVVKTRSYDGSCVLYCDGWTNPCGHIDKYVDCVNEAVENGLNGGGQ